MNNEQIGKNMLNARKRFDNNPYGINSYQITTVEFKGNRVRKNYRRNNLYDISKDISTLRKHSRKRKSLLQTIFSKQSIILGVLFLGVSKLLEVKQTQQFIQEESYQNTYKPNSGRLSKEGKNLIRKKESFRSKAYRLKGEKYWTIGYGHNGPDVKPGQIITIEQAEKLFENDVVRAENAVNTQVKVPISQNMFDALVSFTFNIGTTALASSTLLKKLNAKDYKGAQQEFHKWIKDGEGKVSQGLILRRAKEAEIFGLDIGQDNKLNTNKVTFNPNTTSNNGKTFNGRRVTSEFGDRVHPITGILTPHKGIDLDYKYEPVKAFIGGIVTIGNQPNGYGKYVVITESRKDKIVQHYYAHLSRIDVKNGEKINKGQQIGISGETGASKGPHLHYEIRINNKAMDPREYSYKSDNYNQINKNQEKSINNIENSKPNNVIEQITETYNKESKSLPSNFTKSNTNNKTIVETWNPISQIWKKKKS